MDHLLGAPGGAQDDSLTTSELTLDLTALAKYPVLIWSDDQDIWFSFSASASGNTLVTSGDSAASLTSLKADRAAKSIGKVRVVSPKYPYLVVKSVTSTGTIHVKVVGGQNRSL